jgi:hypothetical protein
VVWKKAATTGHQLDQGAFQVADAAAQAFHQQVQAVFRDAHPAGGRLGPQDLAAHLGVGRLQLRHQAPVPARAQPRVQAGDLGRQPVAGADDPGARVAQVVDGVEELQLGRLLPGQELDVLHHQQLAAAVAALEGVHAAAADGRLELAGEGLGRGVERAPRARAQRLGHHRARQVGLAQAGGTGHVDAGEPGLAPLGHGQAGLARQRIAGAHHEAGEGVGEWRLLRSAACGCG